MRRTQSISAVSKVVSTDPPYYDNIGYADLSDFFYVWLRRSLKPGLPRSLRHACRAQGRGVGRHPYRHGSKEKAENFFLDGMTEAMRRPRRAGTPGLPGHHLLRL
jgi:putative DNA methylase